MSKPAKQSRSKQQHLDDLKLGKYHFSQGGKACLNRHESDYRVGNPCSHRWQARQMGLTLRKLESGHEGQNLYKWPSDIPKQPPAGGNWDLEGSNFTTSASLPYEFEAHHIVPTNELMSAINSIGKESPLKNEIKILVRKGLMEEGYNLNYMINMLILPMMHDEAFALALPKHKRTVDQFSHHLYSSYVRSKLKAVFADVKKDVDMHEAEAKENEKASKQNQKEAQKSDKEAARQQGMVWDAEKKGHAGRATTHRERADAQRTQAGSRWTEAQAQADEAREQRLEALNKVKSSPAGEGKEGIELLSEFLREQIIACGLWLKLKGRDGSLEDLREFLKQRDAATRAPPPD